MARFLLIPLTFLLLLLPLNGGAWARLGHRLVADLAATRLTPQAQAEVAKLLSGEPDPTLGGIASWADDLRDTDPDRFKATSKWHYINAKGGGCGFDVQRDCPDGNCAVSAIEAQLAILADRNQPLEKRRDALKFVVHIVGDLHQPMHAGDRPDSGGNRFQVSLRTGIEPEAYARSSYANGVMGTNLHSIWDYYILASAKRTPAKYERKLKKHVPAIDAAQTGTPLSWARESCALIGTHSLYPSQHVMDRSYLEQMRPLAEQRVEIAAARLAELLNKTLS
ncbi:MAG: S1/P1 nuclease [Pseudoxanthomonas sp.]